MSAVAAGDTILTPNTELAAALFDAAERAHQDAGRDIWPTPQVRDFGSWLRERHAARQAHDAASTRVLGPADQRELWRSVIEASALGAEILEPAGAARAAERARRALHEHKIPLPAVASHAAASDESRAFLEWNRAFDARCRELNCISADELPGLAPAPAVAVTWIESPAWRPAARRWLEQHGRALAAPVIGPSSASRLHGTSPAEEVAAIADWAAANLRSSERFRAWVCIPDLSQRRAEVVDAFDAALAPDRFALSGSDAAPYAVAGGTPLADFAPVRAALEMLAASVNAVPFERFSRLLRAPELHASQAESAAAARLDLQLRSAGPHEADLTTWLALTERVAAAHGIDAAWLQRLQGALRTLEELRGNQAISRWVGAWITAFEQGPWALRHRWSSAEYQAAERFRELLAELATADPIFGSHSRRSAQRILHNAARDTAFQVQTGIPPIWVSGQLIDPWLNYQGLWVSGCNDERWPPPVDPIPLLPVRLQREFGVIQAAPESQLHFASDLQSRWQMRAAECMFSYADPGDGRRAAPSPLLPQVPAARVPATARPHWLARLNAAPALERLNDELAPPVAAGESTRGVSALRAQSRCAFRGFAEGRLRAEILERPVPGFNERERGDLVHHALEHIWNVLGASPALQSIAPGALVQLLDEAVTSALARVCRKRDPGARWRARERERMHGVLQKWLAVERQREPFAVEQLERGAATARYAGLDFNVRIDRVDRLADGARVLIDYKTGMAGVDWRGDRPDNPQLPIYALLQPKSLVAVAYGRVNAADCRFIAETDRPAVFKPGRGKTALEGLPSLALLIEVWEQRISNLAADFADGRAAVAPTAIACRSCRLHGLCRVPAALEDEVDSNE
jgi:ATP-dependent helicase/nuclease subunit B